MKTERQWQARFRNSIGGILFCGARRRGRGKWLSGDDVPQEVRDYLHLKLAQGAGRRYYQRDWKSLELMNDECRPESHFYRQWLVVGFRVNEEAIRQPAKIEVDLGKLRDVLRGINEGRNLDSCFDVVSFGWKDADLDPSGCTGIKSLDRIEGKRVVVTVGGHKTFCDPCQDEDSGTEMSDSDWCAHSIVCECGTYCEWTGDDWCASFSEIIKVPVVHSKGVVDYDKTSRRIIKAAEKCIAPIADNWADTDKSLDELYNELHKEREVS
jgi:hypothetical protein